MSRSKLEELATRWVPGEGPVAIQPLASGLVNASYRVTRAGRQFSLRVTAADGEEPGLDRRWECAVLEVAAATGLAPTVHVCDPRRGVLVADWLRGRAWTAAEARRPDNLETMAQVLRRVHSLRIPEPACVMHPAAWIAHYTRALVRHGGDRAARLAGLRGAAEARLALFGVVQSPGQVLCHSDLHRLNLLIVEPRAARGSAVMPVLPVLLDWEYAHVSDAFWDVAGWAANNDLTAVESGLLLTRYLHRSPDAAELTRLEVLQWLYDLVCLLWLELYSSERPGADSRAVAGRAKQLAMRLTGATRPTRPTRPTRGPGASAR